MPEPLHGSAMWLAGLALALANFMVVLDMTVTAVAVPHIAGGLAASPSQGTWTITSYAVAEAISLPLTGWLAARFGTVRWFLISLLGFGFFSLWCGISQTLPMLVTGRVLQGLFGGPMMPLTQTMLLRVFPPNKQPVAMALWAMTTVTAPIVGPIVGGVLSDDWSWPWIFFINLPIIAFSLFMAFRHLPRFETPRIKAPIDFVGLLLLVLWVGAFQIMLDTGQENGWFGSSYIIALTVVAVIGCAAFLIWEWNEPNPMVDLRMFKNYGFAISCFVMSATYGGFISMIVLIPIWVQQSLGYSAYGSGQIMAFMGVLALFASPISAWMMSRIDVRISICAAICWMGLLSLLRAGWNMDSSFWALSLPQLLQGAAIPFYFMGTTALALSFVSEKQMASAAGLMSFVRTLAGAVTMALVTANWIDMSRATRAEMVPSLNGVGAMMEKLHARGLTMEQARASIERMVDLQATTVAMTHIYLWVALFFVLSGAAVWLVPRPKGPLKMGGGGH